MWWWTTPYALVVLPSGERLSREAAAPYAARRSVEPSILRLARRLYDAGWTPAFRSRKWAQYRRGHRRWNAESAVARTHVIWSGTGVRRTSASSPVVGGDISSNLPTGWRALRFEIGKAAHDLLVVAIFSSSRRSAGIQRVRIAHGSALPFKELDRVMAFAM